MKKINVTAHVYESDDGEERFNFEVNSEGMNAHEHIASLATIFGYEMGKCSSIFAKKLCLSKSKALRVALKLYYKQLYHGFRMGLDYALNNDTEEK